MNSKSNATKVFSNKWGVVLASLGMAIGAGNLWRFPRLAGQYGGTFILLWFIFLFIWSIPILLTEFAIGKHFKAGIIKSFEAINPKIKVFKTLGWMVTIITEGIAFYYGIVTVWAARYFGHSILLLGKERPSEFETYWQSISNESQLTIFIFILVVMASLAILYFGIKNGLEKANKILIPSLFLMLLILAAYNVISGRGTKAIAYLFTIDFALFKDYKVWLEALTQSAWSTGAGWGLLLTISRYARPNEDVTFSTVIGGVGNNIASILAAIVILPSVFYFSPTDGEAIQILQSGNQALIFQSLPLIFNSIPGGAYLMIFFFLTFLFAAFSSFLPMVELVILNFEDHGLTRSKAIVYCVPLFLLFGIPSAYSLDVFNNQDWVWGLGLIVSGLIFVVTANLVSLDKIKREWIDPGSEKVLPTVYFKVTMMVNILLAVVLLYWWIAQEYEPWFDEAGQWNVFSVYSNASVITQWGVMVVLSFFGARFFRISNFK